MAKNILKCDGEDCLNCKLPKCVYDIKDEDILDQEIEIDISNRHKKYYQKNRKKVLKRCKKYYHAHKEEIRAKKNEEYANDVNGLKTKAKAYYQANKEEILLKAKERRLAKKNASNSGEQDLCG